MRYHATLYLKLTKDRTRYTNSMKSTKKEFGDVSILQSYKESIKQITSEREKVESKLLTFFEECKLPDDIEKSWKGAGKLYITLLISLADPRDFSSINKYLRFCGYKAQDVSSVR